MSLNVLLSGDTVTVTPYMGDGAYGPIYGAPVDVDCRVVHERKLVRDTAGDEVVSESTIYVLPVVAAGPAVDLFAPESQVAFQTRTARVIGVAPHRGLGAPVLVEITTT